jgi:hypothetical protein
MEVHMLQAGGKDSGSQQKKFLCIATFLPLKSWKYVIPFQLMTSKVLKQIKQNEGVTNYAVKANFLKKHFLDTFYLEGSQFSQTVCYVRTHATAIKKFDKWAGEGSVFVEWSSQSDMIDWTEALRKLQEPTFYYKKEELVLEWSVEVLGS